MSWIPGLARRCGPTPHWAGPMIPKTYAISIRGRTPFNTIYLHGLVRDEKGEKMSKVRGNVLNPLDTLEQYGTDALRFALSTGTSPGNDIKLTPVRLEAGRNFANKMWNATRFIIRSIEPDSIDTRIQAKLLPVEDRWILSRLNHTVANVTNLMEDFQFGEAQRQIHDFLWGEFCDWYIEIAKIRLQSAQDIVSPIPVLVYVMETSLRLLHPFMPFLTEELWQNLKKRLPSVWQNRESIMIAPYPEASETATDLEAERVMASIIEIIRSIRNARAEYKVESSKWITAQVYAGRLSQAISPHSETIQSLARAKPVTFYSNWQERTTKESALTLVLQETEVVTPMESMLDLAAERGRLQKEMEQSQSFIAQLETRLKDRDFLTKAPKAVIDKEQDKLVLRKSKLERLREQLASTRPDGTG